VEFLGPFIYGIGTGFLMSVLLGVIFFMLIQVGIKHDWKKGFTIASGVITGDILFVALAIGFTGYIRYFLREHESAISIFGGSVMLVMGVVTFAQSRGNMDISENTSTLRSARDFYLKPFVINLVNPANAAWWLGLYSMPPALNYETDQKIVFAAGAVATVFFTEVGVAAAASKLKKYITVRILKRIDAVVGTALLLVGLRLVLKGGGWISF
jgi:L-lysine exporter family protein LysE/ArgO